LIALPTPGDLISFFFFFELTLSLSVFSFVLPPRLSGNIVRRK
jgi:hypothetical protein